MNLARRLMKEVSRRHKHIVVIGDTMTDVWVHGRTSGCQEGCLKFIEESRTTTPGGAANARRSIGNWELRASLFGHPDNERPVKRRYVNSKNQILFRDDDETMLVGVRDYGWIRDFAMTAVRQCDGVLLSDYDKKFLTPEFIKEVVLECCRRGIPCVADCKRAGNLYEHCTIKANADYFDRTENLDYMLVQSRGKGLVMTRGGWPPVVYDTARLPEGARSATPAEYMPLRQSVPCVNHVGAGDCFAAHLTLALACGLSLKEAAALAHSAGRVYVQHPHSRAPLPSEIAADLDHEVLPIPDTPDIVHDRV